MTNVRSCRKNELSWHGLWETLLIWYACDLKFYMILTVARYDVWLVVAVGKWKFGPRVKRYFKLANCLPLKLVFWFSKYARFDLDYPFKKWSRSIYKKILDSNSYRSVYISCVKKVVTQLFKRWSMSSVIGAVLSFVLRLMWISIVASFRSPHRGANQADVMWIAWHSDIGACA